MAGGFEMMDDRVYNEQELKGLLPVSVLSEIPVISAPATERAEQKKSLARMGHGGCGICHYPGRIRY